MNEILKRTYELGQSIWYDSISRGALEDGTLARLAEEGVRGVTTNPSIFQKAIAGSCEYDEDIRRLAKAGKSDTEIYDALTAGDVKAACAVFEPVWAASNGNDGFVSLEVNPLIAEDCAATVSEAIRLWNALDRKNAMIKIPATDAGVAAIEEAVYSGISVNATLIFSVAQYRAVAEAYIRGLERRNAENLPLTPASVASVFVSRIDSAVDPVLAEKEPALAGRIAVSNARVVYSVFEEQFGSDRWNALAAKGARVQRPLWASTGTKNKSYSPTLYVDSLIGAHTVNTVPPATLDAFMKSGTPALTVKDGSAAADLERLGACGVCLNSVTDKLLADGLAAFVRAFEDLMGSIAEKRRSLCEGC
ncbi:MAG: transaldolase [Pyramidobacter sp.]|nr:transaldolase [Pyramidobacter sp.]